MKRAEREIRKTHIQGKNAGSFFDKSEEPFFKPVLNRPTEFFSSNSGIPPGKSTIVQAKSNKDVIDKKPMASEEANLVQREEQPDATVTKGAETNPVSPANPGNAALSPRLSKCYTDPEFPDFKCLTYALKLDIDENLWNNAPQFYRVATLYPGDNKLMLDTFLRYGVGVNLLQTGFGFAGAGKKTANVLSYGTGIALKSYDFLQNGVIKLDVPISLGKGLNLDLKFDLNADPNNLSKVQGVDTQVGISGHF